MIGSLGLHYSWANDDDNYKCLKVKEIGYVLSKDYWGKGLMPEAVNTVKNFCFNEYDLDAITCGNFDINAQSRMKSIYELTKELKRYKENINNN